VKTRPAKPRPQPVPRTGPHPELKGYDVYMHCIRPDRDSPGTICGYPFPCPWHTVTIDLTGETPEVTVPVLPHDSPAQTAAKARTAARIASALHKNYGVKKRPKPR